MSRSIVVDVDLDDFDTDDLISELESRGDFYKPNQSHIALITKIYEKRRLGQDIQRDLDDLIYDTIGRIS